MNEYHKKAYEQGIISTTNGEPELFDSPAPGPIDKGTGRHTNYWVLSEEERKKGFVRPIRQSYQHVKCGTTTRMGKALAETYARQPDFYGATFCCACREHYPVTEFLWIDISGNITNEIVGS